MRWDLILTFWAGAIVGGLCVGIGLMYVVRRALQERDADYD